MLFIIMLSALLMIFRALIIGLGTAVADAAVAAIAEITKKLHFSFKQKILRLFIHEFSANNNGQLKKLWNI